MQLSNKRDVDNRPVIAMVNIVHCDYRGVVAKNHQQLPYSWPRAANNTSTTQVVEGDYLCGQFEPFCGQQLEHIFPQRGCRHCNFRHSQQDDFAKIVHFFWARRPPLPSKLSGVLDENFLGQLGSNLRPLSMSALVAQFQISKSGKITTFLTKNHLVGTRRVVTK